MRGLYLSILLPQRTNETGLAYVNFLRPILAERRKLCDGDVKKGLPDFFCFDNGSAYQLFALAAAGEQWPQGLSFLLPLKRLGVFYCVSRIPSLAGSTAMWLLPRIPSS